jgi:hypothetical protein
MLITGPDDEASVVLLVASLPPLAPVLPFPPAPPSPPPLVLAPAVVPLLLDRTSSPHPASATKTVPSAIARQRFRVRVRCHFDWCER